MNDRIIEFDPLIEGVLIKRYKRFLADIKLKSGEVVTAHCANTGPMKGLLSEGAKVRISASPSRKRISQVTKDKGQCTTMYIQRSTVQRLTFNWKYYVLHHVHLPRASA